MMAEVPQIELVIIDDSLISSFLADGRFLKAFPCLDVGARQLVGNTAGPGCPKCKQKAMAQRRTQVMTNIKICLQQLATPKKIELKTLLNAVRVRITRKGIRGDIVITY